MKLNKTQKYILIILILLFSNIAYGQILKSKEDIKGLRFYNSTLKTNPFAMLIGPIILAAEYRLSYETVLSDNQSFQIGASYLGKSFYLLLMEKSDPGNFEFLVRGYRAQLTYKIFLTREETPEGLYIGPHFSYSYCKFSTKYLNNVDDYIKAVYVNYNAIIGYQFIYNKFAIEAYLGAGYRDNAWIEHYNQVNNTLDEDYFMIYKGDLKLILGFNAGFVF